MGAEDDYDDNELDVLDDEGFANGNGHTPAENNYHPESGVQEFMFDSALYHVYWEACERVLDEYRGSL